MHTYHLLEILAIGFGLALAFGYLARRLGLSPIVGYLAAGFLVGPYTPGFVADGDITNNLAEAGIILLMFGVGLHFHTDDLMAVKGVAIPGAIVQSAAAAFFGAAAAMAAGYSGTEGLILGLGLSVASTVVLLRVLTDSGRLDSPGGTVAVGWLVVEDIFTVFMLVLLPAVAPSLLAGTSLSPGALLWAVFLALMKLVLLWIIVMAAGGRLMPRLLKAVVRTRSSELFTLSVLAAAFLTAMGAAYIFDASFALGAFLGGMVVGKSKVSHQAGAELIPFRDAFSVLFFLSVGMLFDPAFLLKEPLLVVLSLLVVLLVKPLATILIISLLGRSVTTALTVAAGLSQVGEFSFILAQTGFSLGLVSEDMYSVLIICALVSIAVNPFLMAAVPKGEDLLRRHPVLWKWLTVQSERKAAALETTLSRKALSSEEKSAVIAGFGPTGQAAAAVLQDSNVTPVVVDMNLDTVTRLEKEGISAFYGDVSREEVLKAAGMEKAAYFIITIPDAGAAAAAVVAARNINSKVIIFARTRFLQDGALLKEAGANVVLYEEEAVAAAMKEALAKETAPSASPAAAVP